jgi:hypothetical protein
MNAASTHTLAVPVQHHRTEEVSSS